MTEHLEGIGQVFAEGGYLIDMYYQLEVIEDAAGFKRTFGRVQAIEEPSLIYDILEVDGTTTLHLSDGLQLDFAMTTLEGDIRGDGPISEREK